MLQCHVCSSRFTLFLRKHHCRQCGRIFCDNCSRGRRKLRNSTADEPVRVCDGCDRMLSLEDDSHTASHSKQHHTVRPVTTPTHPAPAVDVMAAMSLSSEAIDGANTAAVSGGRLAVGGAVMDCAPLIAALLVEVECGERLRSVHDRMREEMDAMLRLLVTEMSAVGGRQAVEEVEGVS